jgi:hypothetical protein
LLTYGAETFKLDASIVERLDRLSRLIYPPIVLLLPAAVAAIGPYRRGAIQFVFRTSNPHCRLLWITATVLIAALGLLILVGGLHYSRRFSFAWLPLAIVLAACTVRMERTELARWGRVMLGVWGGVLAGTAVYGVLTPRESLREPAPAAAQTIRQHWQREYGCGPAYITGAKDPAFEVALYFGGRRSPVIGVAHEDYYRAQWVDKERIRRLGAVVIGSTEAQAIIMLAIDFPARTDPVTLQLPYRRTWSEARYFYIYTFIPPQGC